MPAMAARPHRALLLPVAAVVISACTTSPVYLPNVTNTPQVMRRGDAEGAVWVSNEGVTQLQTSVALTRKFVVSANGSFISAGCPSCPSRRLHQFAEVGLGMYSTNIDDRTTSYTIGYGMGTSNWVSAHETSGPGLLSQYRAEGNFSRGFIQIAAVDRQERYSVSTSARISGVFFSKYQRYALDTGSFATAQYNTPITAKGNTWSLYIEPAMRILWNVKAIRLGPQFGFALPLNAPPRFGHRPVFINLGIDLGGR